MADFMSSISELPVADIEEGTRLRPVSQAAVTVLMQVIQEHGFTVPIVVRKVKTYYILIDGAHRLEAAKRLGMTMIPVRVYACTNVEARAMETTQNLAGASLSPLDDAVFLAAYSKAYEEMHPETVRGMAGALAKHGSATELSSFADVIAEKRSITPRQVRKIVAAGHKITAQDAEELRRAAKKITLKDIECIGKIADVSERSQVIARLSGGTAKSASDARRQINAKPGDAHVSDADKKLRALQDAFARAPLAARRAFVAEHADVLRELLPNQEADATGVVPFVRARA